MKEEPGDTLLTTTDDRAVRLAGPCVFLPHPSSIPGRRRLLASMNSQAAAARNQAVAMPRKISRQPVPEIDPSRTRFRSSWFFVSRCGLIGTKLSTGVHEWPYVKGQHRADQTLLN